MRSLKTTTSSAVAVVPADAESVATTAPAPVSAIGIQPSSPWHSPVPYLFGGLAAMLGLVAFALLILVCSFWKLTYGQDENEEVEMKNKLENEKNIDVVYEEQFVVILAGDDKPSCLATPAVTTTRLNSSESCSRAMHNRQADEAQRESSLNTINTDEESQSSSNNNCN